MPLISPLAKTAASFPAVYPVRFAGSFLVFCRNIGRIDDQAIDLFSLNLSWSQKPLKPAHKRYDMCSWKCFLQIISKFLNLWRLGEGLMFKLLGMVCSHSSSSCGYPAHGKCVEPPKSSLLLFPWQAPLGIYVLRTK